LIVSPLLFALTRRSADRSPSSSPCRADKPASPQQQAAVLVVQPQAVAAVRAVPQRAAAVAVPVVLPAVAAVQDARSGVAVVQAALPEAVAAQVVLQPAAEVQDARRGVVAVQPDEPQRAAAQAEPLQEVMAEAAQGERPLAAVVLAGLPPEAAVEARPDELQRAAEVLPAEAIPVEPQPAARPVG
jgi:hypothetical protein